MNDMTCGEQVKGEFICALCPDNCTIDAVFVMGRPPKLMAAIGAKCKQGNAWIVQEVEAPMRTLSTSVPVKHGDRVCASVRTTSPVPLKDAPKVMAALRAIVLKAPVNIGQVVAVKPGGIETTVIATCNIECVSQAVTPSSVRPVPRKVTRR